MNGFKNGRLTEQLVGDIPIEYSTWTYNNNCKCYFDVIVTSKKIMVVGRDIVVNWPFKRISDFGSYFGEDSEDYEENYFNSLGHWWRFGHGDIGFFFHEVSEKNGFLIFQNPEKKMQLNYIKLLTNVL